MNVLVVNAGSSSLKYQLINTDTEAVLIKGLVERIGLEGSLLTQKNPDKGVMEIKRPMQNHEEAMQALVDAITDPQKGAVASMDEIEAVGHRVLHGGASFTESQIVTPAVIQAIKDNFILGPLHNPANLQGIQACQKLMPKVKQVAVFDTAFHQTMPPHAYLYGVPYELYEELKIRRYGFHGTSHRYVSQRVAKQAGKDIKDLKIITCHLGNGSSISAVKAGKCVDTSMGLTPLEGLLMGTRSGSLDPAVVEFVATQKGLTVQQTLTMLNKQSGLLGISGVSSDMRDLQKAISEGNERAKIALDMLVYGIKKYIGSYIAAMNGVDVIAFTGGIGENDALVRELVMDNMDYLGICIDKEKNVAENHHECELTAPGSKVRVFVVETNEELAIARDTLALVQK